MATRFLLYGANGFVGEAIARLAVQQGLQPTLAGRDAAKIERLAAELAASRCVFGLDDAASIDRALADMPVVLHCAGPFVYTSRPMVEACLRTGTHYLDLTGEIPVYEALAARHAEAQSRGVMLVPAVGFDVVPTDCLALHLQRRLPAATQLALAFQSQGPAGLPPGTQRTFLEMIPFGDRVRRNGRLERPERAGHTRRIDFGRGPLPATRLPWGDVFTAYHSTGIPNIVDYAVLPIAVRRQMAAMTMLRPLFRLKAIRTLAGRGVKPGPTAGERAQTVTHVWGEVRDDRGALRCRGSMAPRPELSGRRGRRWRRAANRGRRHLPRVSDTGAGFWCRFRAGG